MLSVVHSVILGAVEGITEFLPISSTAHLMLATRALGIPFSAFTKTFTIAIQSGAILAVVVLYWKTLFRWQTICKLMVAFIPTGIIGLALYPFVSGLALENISLVLTALALGGAFLVVFEHTHASKPLTSISEYISYRQAIGIGFAQSLAIIPGVSRAAATVIGGMAMGISRKAMVEFSFVLAVPTMFAATGLDLLKHYSLFTHNEFATLAIGFITAFLTSLIAITWLLNFVRTHSFASFGWYRIGLVVIVLVVMMFA